MRNVTSWGLLFVAFLLSPGLRHAAAQDEKPGEAKVETVITGLKNPCGIALQPETGTVFVSDSGAGRVCRIVEGKLEPVVVDSPLDTYGPGPKYEIGPLGIAFVDKDTLVVGDGGYADGKECLRFYKVPAPGSEPLNHESGATTTLGPLDAKDGLKAEGNFYALAVGKGGIYVTSNGDDDHGWIHRATMKGSKFAEFGRAIATKAAIDVDAPIGITINARGEIVVGQMGEIDKPADSQLSFYSAKTGELLLNLPTGLHDITAVAYSPKTGLLYATDFSWAEPDAAGLYRLDSDSTAGQQKVKATRIAKLDRPTAIAFDKDGAAYITVFGMAGETIDEPAGAVVKIGGL